MAAHEISTAQPPIKCGKFVVEVLSKCSDVINKYKAHPLVEPPRYFSALPWSRRLWDAARVDPVANANQGQQRTPEISIALFDRGCVEIQIVRAKSSAHFQE